MSKTRPVNPIALYFPEIALIGQSPRFLTIATNGVFEVYVNALVEKKCKNERAKNLNYGNKVLLLHEIGVLSDLQFKQLEVFRDLRNKAAHGYFEITQSMLEPFNDMTYRTTKKDFDKTENYQHLCMLLVCGFYNDFIDVFGSHFKNMAITQFHPSS